MNELIILAILSIENEDDKVFMSNIYINYYGLMYKNALGYVKEKHDAEEIVHDAFIKLIKKISLLKTFKCHTLASYIVFTIKSTSVDYLRSRNRDLKSMFLYGDDAVNDIHDDTDSLEEIIINKYENEVLHKAVEQLNPKYQFTIENKYFNNMSDSDIAKILDITPDNVRKYLERARKALKKILEKEHNFNGIE